MPVVVRVEMFSGLYWAPVRKGVDTLRPTIKTARLLHRIVSERSIVEFVEEWQTGFFVVLASAVVGVVLGLVASSSLGPPGFYLGFAVGVLLSFLAYSYLRYGR